MAREFQSEKKPTLGNYFNLRSEIKWEQRCRGCWKKKKSKNNNKRTTGFSFKTTIRPAWKIYFTINLSLNTMWEALNQKSYSVNESRYYNPSWQKSVSSLALFLTHRRNTTFTGPFLITCMSLKPSFSWFIPFIIVSSSFSRLDSTFLHLFNLFISLLHTTLLNSVSIPLSWGQWRVSKCNGGEM